MRVYEYGCLPPDTNADLVMEQIRLGHAYRNKLTEFDRDRRVVTDPLVFVPPSTLKQQVDNIKQELDALNTQHKKIRAKARGRVAMHPSVAARRKELKAQMKDLKPTLALARKADRDRHKALIEAAESVRDQAVKELRKGESAPFWGTYSCLEAAAKQSWKDAESETYREERPWDFPHLPSFHRWDGSGMVAVQLHCKTADIERLRSIEAEPGPPQNETKKKRRPSSARERVGMLGLPVSTLMAGTDTFLRLTDAIPRHGRTVERRCAKPGCLTLNCQNQRHPHNSLPTPSAERIEMYKRLWIRIGSDGVKPIWAVLPIILDRPLPLDGVVAWCKVFRERIGPNYRWLAQFTVLVPALGTPSYPVSGPERRAAVNTGWRLLPDGSLRVATLVDDTGHQEFLTLPPDWVEGMVRANPREGSGFGHRVVPGRVKRLQQERDLLVNNLDKDLRLWADGRVTPDWWKFPQKPAPSRYGALVSRWAKHRFPGDEAMFDRAEFWRKRDKHLWCYQEHLRDQLIARRTDIYRKWCDIIARRYTHLYRDDAPLKKFQSHAEPGREKEEAEDPQKVQQRAAAIYSLRAVLVQQLWKQRGIVIPLASANITMTCSECGCQGEFDPAGPPLKTWPCGHTLDQDVNACRNLLRIASGQGMPESLEALAS